MAHKKVLYARLQTAIDVPNAMGLGLVFPNQSKTLSDLVMSTDDSVLNVSFSFRGIKKNILIPLSNVVVLDLAPEEPKSK